MSRLPGFLREEILWGRMALIALGAALASELVLSLPVLESFTLIAFTIAGILVERSARRHPLWNALVCGLLAVVWKALLALLVAYGAEEPLPGLAELGLLFLFWAVPILPLVFVGTAMVVLFRRIGQRARAGQGAPEEPPARPGAEREAKAPGPRQAPPRRPPPKTPRKPAGSGKQRSKR